MEGGDPKMCFLLQGMEPEMKNQETVVCESVPYVSAHTGQHGQVYAITH